MNNLLNGLGAIAIFFLIVVIVVVISEKINKKKQKEWLEDLKDNFKAFYGPEFAEEKLLKDLQTKTVVRPKLKSLALNLDEAYRKESSLEHQIKHASEAAPYNVYFDSLERARNDVKAQETFFFTMLLLAIDLEFVPKETDFKKCLKF